MRKTGFTGTLIGTKENDKQLDLKHERCKSFSLSYNPEKPILYSYAKITIGDRTIITDKAMWDTGATITVISHATANQFDATPNEVGTSISATDRSDSDIYLATIELPGGIVFHNAEVWDVDLSDHGAEVVIGMDIISRGKLVVETVYGVPMFTFSIEQ
ncbi:MAG: retropepsin-like aspartic protease [Lachnospiraceae bacterium]|nr:retropepsin-like aspartic protease [Lachnospiraceae bacterium]